MISVSTIQAWLSLPPLFRHFGLGLLVAIVGVVVSLAPFGRQWEEDLGLTWLFRIRGPVAPPGEVVVVSIDRESSERLGLPGNPRKWPRDLHARLLDRLVEQGASIVAFDVLFQEHRDSARDQIFAESARRAGNVILLEFLKRDILTMETGSAGDVREIVIEQRIPPVPALADAVLGLAPFALPRVPIKVSQVWLFKPEAGGAATLPMVAFYAHRLESYDEVLELLRQLDPGAYAQILRQLGKSEPRTRVDEQVGMLRRLLLVKPLLKPLLLRRIDEMNRAGAPSNRHLSALIAALGGTGSIYLNYYGPPRTIETLSYHELLTGESDHELDLAGRAVFVGAAAPVQPGQQDGFYTPFTLPSGLDIGGVEIAATVFANLLDQNSIVFLSSVQEAGLVFFWGLALGLVLQRFGGGWIPLVAAGAGGGYFAAAYVAFAQSNLWLPLVTPIAVQLLPATFGALLLRYLGLQKERENIRRAFGMHLPLPVVDQLARGIDDFSASAEQAYGICLATDAEDFTTLSERMEPTELKQFMNGYYEAVFRPVRSRGGVVADVVGDAMLAIWAAERNRVKLRRAACEAALEILESVDEFNRSNSGHRLPTRVGLHCGDLVLGHVGAMDHFEFRAVGDIVNATSRIEGLAKRLGARLLVSEDVVSDLGELKVRPLGRFLLKGKTRPLSVAELVPTTLRDETPWERLRERFAEGLDAYQYGDLKRALRCFEAIEQEVGGDGPTAFYRQLCRRYLAELPNEEWTGLIKLAEK